MAFMKIKGAVSETGVFSGTLNPLQEAFCSMQKVITERNIRSHGVAATRE